MIMRDNNKNVHFYTDRSSDDTEWVVGQNRTWKDGNATFRVYYVQQEKM